MSKILSVTTIFDKILTNATEVLLYSEDDFVDNLHAVIYIVIGKTTHNYSKINVFLGREQDVVFCRTLEHCYHIKHNHQELE